LLSSCQCSGTRELFILETAVTPSNHTHRSSYREILIEHLFVGAVMRMLWLRGIAQFEVLKPQVDHSGYDLVLEANGIVRHVQLKASASTSATSRVKASLKLAKKPSGCVVWIIFDPESLTLGPFRWYVGNPGKPMPDIAGFRIAKHTRANSKGVKKERAAQRTIPRAKFEKVDDLRNSYHSCSGSSMSIRPSDS